MTPERAKRVAMGITLTRFPLAALFAWWLLTQGDGASWRWIAAGILLLLEVTDMIDGFIARRYKAVSELGSMMDPYADSFTRLIVYSSLAGIGTISFWLPIVMALRDITVSYCRVVFARHGGTSAAKISGKVKAWVQAVSAFLLLLGPMWFEPGFELMVAWVVAIATVVSAIPYVRGALTALRSGNVE